MRALLLAAALCGCGTPVLGIQVTLLTKACPDAPAALAPSSGVTQLRISLSGDGLTSQTSTVPFASGTAQIPDVPVGTNRRLTVDALAGDRVRAHADSGKFDASGPADVHLTLFLRSVDAFTPTSDASGACSRMVTPRAGHAMALLPDGRVLITGGFSNDGSTPPKLVYHSDAELFDPQSGQFMALSPSPTLRRAGHSALPVILPSGAAVLLAGGEGPDESGTGPVGAVKPLELLVGSAWTELTPPLTSPSRSHAAAAVDLRTGAAVLAGGQSDESGSTVYDSVTWFDPAANAVHESATALRAGQLSDAVAVARANLSGKASLGGVVLVGGRDGTGKVSAQISGLIWGPSPAGGLDFIDDVTFKGAQWQLPSPRALHVALRTVDDLVLTAGGVTSLVKGAFNDYSSATAEITLVDPLGGQVANLTGTLSQARADACGVLLEDGSALIAGGAWQDAGGLHSAKNVDLIGTDRSVRTAAGPDSLPNSGVLTAARHRAACIRLLDGSVLITGGLQAAASGGATVLDTAEIYQPL